MKRIVLLSHCVMNSMCEEPPAADTYRRCILEAAMDGGVSMIQLPCPELCYQALQRESIYPGSEKAAAYADYCRGLLAPLIKNLREYKESGVELTAVIGISTSPSCSVEEEGIIMMEILLGALEEIGYEGFRLIDMPVEPDDEAFMKEIAELF